MGTTVISKEVELVDHFTGEISNSRQFSIKKTKLAETDKYIKVSKYLNVIFAYNGIPLNLVPFCLLVAQRMDYETNKVYLLKPDKEEIALMLNCKTNMVDKYIATAKKFDILRAYKGYQGVFEVNSFLFSCGGVAETRALQAHFDFDSDLLVAKGVSTNLITGKSILKAIANKDSIQKGQIPGQMSLADLGMDIGGAHE